VKKRPVYLFFEHDVPKGKQAQKEYRQWVADKLMPINEKITKKGVKSTGLADTTGHIIGIWEFKDMTAFSELWDDEEYHEAMRGYYSIADNINIRLCRPSVVVPP